MLRAIPAVLRALKAGEALKDPAKWKNIQNSMNALAIIGTSVVTVLRVWFPDLMVSDEELIAYSTIVANILLVANGYLTTATTKKIGVHTDVE
jgi:hypothetical protein